MTSIYHEQAAEQKIRDECGIPADWSAKMWESAVWFLGETGTLAREISEKYSIEDWMGLGDLIRQAAHPMLIPEGCRMFSFTAPAGHESEGYAYLVTASQRDLEMGTTKYLSRLDEDQLYYAQNSIKDLLQQKREEASLTVWRVCNDFMCLGNFREEDYLKAVEFMAEHAKQRLWDEPQDQIRHKALQIEIKAERVPESEYESFFE